MWYVHLREWGVPRIVRAHAAEEGTRETIWDWYDASIVDRYFDRNLHWFLNLDHPVAMMCVVLETDAADWTADQLATLRQPDLFHKAPKDQLEKIPFNFKYEYRCSDQNCTRHTMTCFDWEMGQSFRRWRDDYGAEWEGKIRQRYEDEMINRNDTHFFVGNMHQHPGSWIIVGLFYPPRQAQTDLFGS